MKPSRLLPFVVPALACRPVAAGPSSTEPATASERRAPAPPAPGRLDSEPTSAASSIRFEPRPGPVLKADGPGVPAIAFRKPSADELVDAESLAGFGVEVQGSVEQLGPGARVEVSLDGLRPRPIGGAALALSALSPPDRDLAQGEHFLIAAAVDAAGRLIRIGNTPVSASVRFWFGRRAEAGTAPTLVCWGPNGTYYGATAEPVLDLLLRLPERPGVEPQRIEARLEGPGVGAPSSKALVDAARPWGISGLTSGDYRLVVELQPSGAAPGKGECRFTLNRELERPSP